MLKLVLACALLLAAPAHAQSAPEAVDKPYIGKFNWRTTATKQDRQPLCAEIWEYRADGVKLVASGEERLEKRYSVQGGPLNFLIEETVTVTNSKPDCMGALTPIGATREVYLILLNNGGFFTCPSRNTMSCNSFMHRRQQP